MGGCFTKQNTNPKKIHEKKLEEIYNSYIKN
jgi:hypothetical protein